MPSKTAAAKLALAAIKAAYRKDRAKAYELPVAVNFFFRGVTPPWAGEHYTFEPGIGPDGTTGTYACLRSYSRLGLDGRKVNDGATLASDSVPGAKPGAAAHDPGYREMDAIAAAWADKPYEPGDRWGRDWIARRFSRDSSTWTRADVRQMFDDIFGDVMVESDAGFLARVYHSTVRWVGGIVHDFVDNRRALLPAAAACLLLAGCSGCQSVRDVADWFEGLPAPVELEPDGSTEASQQPPATPPVTPPQPPVTPPAASDAVPYASLSWRISRDRPVGSAPAVVARIRPGKLSGGGLTYSWDDAAAAGKALGSSSHDPAQLRAYVFFGGEGGFFDWCSVTRSSRDFKNVQHEFGWDKVDKARRPVAFFIGSKDGRARTNVIAFP